MNSKRWSVGGLAAIGLAAFMALKPDDDLPAPPQQPAARENQPFQPVTQTIMPEATHAVAASLPVQLPPLKVTTCPVTDTTNSDRVIEELNYSASQKDVLPLDKFKHIFNSYIEADAERFSKIGLSRIEYAQQLQNSAQAAFNSLISAYPHGRLQAMDQSADLAADISGQEMKTLMDVTGLRWSMSTLVVDGEAVPDLQQSRALGGVDINLLDRLIAKLAIAAYPEAVQNLKTIPAKGLTSIDALEQYSRYVELVDYVGSGSAYSMAGLERPDWPELGFENRRDWFGFKQGSKNKIADQKTALAQSVLEACTPALAPR